MDLRNLEATSTYAIEAVYRDYWNQIPEKYRLLEPSNRLQPTYEHPEDYPNNTKPEVKKITPLSYKDVEENDKPKDDYTIYAETLNNKQLKFDLLPFFDPQLDFENRLHYKLTGINYPERKGPWFIITWNSNSGILESSLTNRRFDTAVVETPAGDKVKFDFINTEMDLTLCFTSNTMQGLFELQEHIRVARREKACVDTRPHSILGSFPVSLDLIKSAMSKLDRSKGTLCTLTMSLKIDYPIIGNVRKVGGPGEAYGIIKEIHNEIDSQGGNKPGEHEVLSRDIVDENTREVY